MRYFKIKIGYYDEDSISIDETELETALFCFMTESKGVFKNGVVRGKDIVSISEDWHRAMRYNKGYRLQTEDWTEIDKNCGHYKGHIEKAKQNVQELIKLNRVELIGKPGTIEERLKLLN